MTASKTSIISTGTSTRGLDRGFTDVSFVELLGRSNFSFLQGASHPEEMVLRAQALGYRGLALCDLNGLYGVVRAFQAIEYPSHFTTPRPDALTSKPFTYHCGAEMQLIDRSSIALLPMNKDGYNNLCRIVTESKRSSEKGFSNLDFDHLEKYGDDLIALALPPWTEEKLNRLRGIFEDRLYLPVWKDFTWESLAIYRQGLELEEKWGYKLFATQRPLMHERERKPVHDVLTCILHGTSLLEAKTRLIANGERHLKPLVQLRQLWDDRPDLLARTCEISARLQFSLHELHYEYPHAVCPEGLEAADYLRTLALEGIRKRFPDGVPEEVLRTIDHEMALITELRYEDYFLTLWDVCQFAVKKGIMHQGRGSAANSVVCYAIGLTAVDPTKVKLLFERFISKERGEPPDIDIDFESGRREEVIQYIYEKYGASHAAMVCTVICFRTRMALRESAKVLGIPLPTVEKMTKFMGREGLRRLEEMPEQLKEWNIDEKTYLLLLHIARSIKGFPRHLGIHSGGFLIAKRPISECVPVEKATMDQRYVIQWNKDDLTVLKMLKIDVLGLGMLTALEKCFALLREHRGIEMGLATVPHDDTETYEMTSRADTVGVFQIESRAQMSLLPRLKPRTFYDLVIEVAIVRPGPIQGGMIHPFIRRRHGQEAVTYPHEDLRPILEKTCGVPIFQEQIMQIASAVGGFTAGEADELRRIMSSSWKKHDLMEGMRQRLINGMLNHGIEIAYAEQIYQTIVGFASYGFPESHAASFALLTYASCYLKCHYPDLFVTSLLNAQPMGFYSPRALIADAQRHNVKFMNVDVQKSEYDYTIEKDGVRVGLRAIHSLKQAQAEELLKARREGGPFKDLRDLVTRARLKKESLIRLGAAGALESFGYDPRQALWKIQALCLDPQNLFFAQETARDAELLPKEDEWDQLQRGYETKGYSLTRHPMGILRPALKGFVTAADLPGLKNKTPVRLAGLLALTQRPPTAKGFAFLTLEDETGSLNIILTPPIYEQFRLVLGSFPMLHVCGIMEKVDGVINIKAQIIKGLPIEKILNLLPPQIAPAYDFSKCGVDHSIG